MIQNEKYSKIMALIYNFETFNKVCKRSHRPSANRVK